MSNISRDTLIKNHEQRYNKALGFLKVYEKQMKTILANDELMIENKANGQITNPIVKCYFDSLSKFNSTAQILAKLQEKVPEEKQEEEDNPFEFNTNK